MKPLPFLGAVIAILLQAAIAAGILTNGGPGFSNAFVGYAIVVTILWALVYGLTRAKNHAAGSWLAATFFFGPIPLLILLFIPRKNFREGETKLCPHCRSEVPIDATVCRYCSRDVVPGAVGVSTAPSADEAQLR